MLVEANRLNLWNTKISEVGIMHNAIGIMGNAAHSDLLFGAMALILILVFVLGNP